MYSYTYDERTGGILLNSSPTVFSKEPRPVFAPELDTLGFDKYWTYSKQDEAPYMWAESVNYYYRGKLVAKLKGGDLLHAPEIIIPNDENGNPVLPEPAGGELRPIDIEAMVKANMDLMDVVETSTEKKIVAIYEKYKDKLDIFHVAFSGGKDSAVLLDLVKKALPQKSFVVIFGNTGMEFPDTYEAAEITKQMCEAEGIPFFVSESHYKPCESWATFGPPARVIRWCCSVHKSTPQTLKMREITGKNDYVGMDFVGVRRHESLARSKYDYENYGEKQKGQYSFNAILDWTSAEIWLYIFSNNLNINKAYKKGNSRAGCLFCPMSGGLSDYMRRQSYPVEIDEYVDMIKAKYASSPTKTAESYIINGGWNARKNGRELLDTEFRCVEKSDKGYLTIDITRPTSSWKEWIKTLGRFKEIDGHYSVEYEGIDFPFEIKETSNGYVASISEELLKAKPTFGKYFRQVFRKASYCVGCRVCETNCRRGCISFTNGKVSIENCIHCHQCHQIDSGCLLFHSTRHPQGGGRSLKSLNSFADHAPKPEWLQSFFELKDDFFTNHTLGPMMYDMFRRFLKDAGLNEKNHFTKFAELISQIGWESNTAMGLIFTNLVFDNPQVEWYVKNLDIGSYYERSQVEDMLTAVDVKPKDAKSIIKAYKRLTETPLGTTLCFGYVTDEQDLVRTKCSISDNRVVLYALFRFAEKCNNFREFTLSWLMNDGIDRDGISPTRIFGLDYFEMQSILMGLSAKYPDFIKATFTNDLEKITLEEKTPDDVLRLFEEEF